MASGNESLQLTEAGTWESFPLFAEKYVKQIGATVKQKIEGPDAHVWEIEYQVVLLNFIYHDFPNVVSLAPKSKEGQAAVDFLYKLALEQSREDGALVSS